MIGSQCNVWTYLYNQTSQDPVVFDHLHFLASLHDVRGVS